MAEAIFHRRLEDLEKNVIAAAESEGLRAFVGRMFAIELDQYADYLNGQADPKAQIGETRTLSRERRKRIGSRFAALLEKIGALLEERGLARDPDLPLLPAQMLLENVFWLPGWIDHFREWEFAQVRDHLTELFCNGLAAEHASYANSSVTAERESALQSEDVGERFLRVATQLVSQRGYRGTSIDAISAALGVTKGSFYHHVAEKKDALAALLRTWIRSSTFQQDASARHENSRRRFGRACLDHFCRSGRAAHLRYSALPGLP